MAQDDQKAIWNVDGAQLYLIFQIKTEASISISNWNLEAAYWRLRDFRREIDAKLNREKKKKFNVQMNGKVESKELTEKEMVDYLLDQMTKERNILDNSQKAEEDISRLYLVEEEFYMVLSELAKKHGLWLREGEDGSDAFRKR